MKHPVFSFSALFIPFFIDFSHFSDQAAYFLLFIALFDFAVTFLLFYSFNVFSLLDMLHSLSIFLAYLSLFFCVQFYVFPNSQRFLFFFSAFFTSYCHSSAPSPLSLLLSPVFFAFSSIPYCICLFSAVFFLFSAHFYLFFYFLSIPPFLALFSPFFSFSSIFSFLLMSLFQARFFTFHTPQNVSRETSFFTISGLQRSVRSDLLFLFPKVTLVFGLSNFQNNRILYPILDFSVFFTFLLYFRMFHVFFYLCFRSFIKLFNYIFIFSYKLNFYIRFFGFSKAFTKRVSRPLFHGFLPIWKDFIP